MAAPAGPGAPAKRKEIYKYEAPWTVFSMNWSVRPDKRFRLALGSFVEEYNNKVQVDTGRACWPSKRVYFNLLLIEGCVTGRGHVRVYSKEHLRPSLPHHQDHVDTRQQGNIPR